MARPLQLVSTDRVLVFAPHPDDETLAVGELIQMARSNGARVRVVFATDGEDNPWPQRWLERRWRIRATERARWATRRRGEAAFALAALGLDPARDARFLGWPDQGLTDVLMQDGQGVEVLAAEIRTFAPTHVVAPARDDRHPDHSALHVMLQLALLDAGIDCARLDFIVHGERRGRDAVEVQPDAVRKQRKLAALDTHASQVALSRRRLVELAMRAERFEVDEDSRSRPVATAVGGSLRVRTPLRAGWPVYGRCELLLVQHTASETFRYRAMLPRRPGRAMSLLDASGRRLPATWLDGVIELELSLSKPVLAIYAKVHRSGPRVVIYDREFWLDVLDPAAASSPAPIRAVVTDGV
jgi:LmbE family N-acetylglucosaminyl deacetylase